MSQQGMIRQRGRTWTAYWYDHDADGKIRQRSKGGFSRKGDAREWLNAKLAAIQSGEHRENAKITLRDYLVDEWLPVQRRAKKASTYNGYRSIVEGRIVPALGGVRLDRLTAGRVAAFYDELRESGSRRTRAAGDDSPAAGLSERSIKHTHTVLHKALEDAVARRMLNRNPLRDLDRDARPKPRNAEMSVWTAEQLRAFLAHTDGDRLHACFVLAATTGLRRGELLGLRWDDVDLDAGQLAVRRSRVSVGYEIVEGEPKSGRARTVAIDDETVAVLRSHRRAQLEERMAFGRPDDDGLVFTREDGSPLHPQTLAWHFTKAVRGAGVPAIRFHDLRHTHATLALKAGVHPKVVQERLGHSSISITLDLYSHVVPGMQEEAAAKVAAAIFGG